MVKLVIVVRWATSFDYLQGLVFRCGDAGGKQPDMCGGLLPIDLPHSNQQVHRSRSIENELQVHHTLPHHTQPRKSLSACRSHPPCQQYRYRTEWLATQVKIKSCYNHSNSGIRQTIAEGDDAIIKELYLICGNDINCEIAQAWRPTACVLPCKPTCGY